MSENLIVSKWLTKRKSLRKELMIETFTVEGIVFEIMPLDKQLTEDLESCLTYQEMLFFAADNGVVCEFLRVADDAELAEGLNELWGDPVMSLEDDPCIRQRVGDKVCEISGLSDLIAEQLEKDNTAKEEAAKLLEVGDHSIPSDVEVDNLDADADNYLTATA